MAALTPAAFLISTAYHPVIALQAHKDTCTVATVQHVSTGGAVLQLQQEDHSLAAGHLPCTLLLLM